MNRDIRAIYWLDAGGRDHWGPEDQRVGVNRIWTVGYVVYEDAECIELTSWRLLKDAITRYVVCIPRVCIIENCLIKQGAESSHPMYTTDLPEN